MVDVLYAQQPIEKCRHQIILLRPLHFMTKLHMKVPHAFPFRCTKLQDTNKVQDTVLLIFAEGCDAVTR